MKCEFIERGEPCWVSSLGTWASLARAQGFPSVSLTYDVWAFKTNSCCAAAGNVPCSSYRPALRAFLHLLAVWGKR